VGSLRRRRPSEEGEYEEELSTYRLQGSRYPGHDKDSARQRLRNGWLNDQVSDVAKRAIGLDRLSVGVRVPGLHDPAEGDKRAAKEAEHHPQQMTCS
jgi:hypothetical protein